MGSTGSNRSHRRDSQGMLLLINSAISATQLARSLLLQSYKRIGTVVQISSGFNCVDAAMAISCGLIQICRPIQLYIVGSDAWSRSVTESRFRWLGHLKAGALLSSQGQRGLLSAAAVELLNVWHGRGERVGLLTNRERLRTTIVCSTVSIRRRLDRDRSSWWREAGRSRYGQCRLRSPIHRSSGGG